MQCDCCRRSFVQLSCLLVSLHTFCAVRAAETALDQYVAKPDPSYAWKVVRTLRDPGLTTFVVDLKSQTWRSPDEVDRTLWQHWLLIAKPDGATSDTAMLFIGGGRNGREAATSVPL